MGEPTPATFFTGDLAKDMSLEDGEKQYMELRNRIKACEEKQHFSHDIELTEDEQGAAEALENLRKQMVDDYMNPSIHDYFDHF